MTRDVERDKKFYADTIGWKFEGMPMPHGTYSVAKMGERRRRAIPHQRTAVCGRARNLDSFFAVDDVDARVKKRRRPAPS